MRVVRLYHNTLSLKKMKSTVCGRIGWYFSVFSSLQATLFTLHTVFDSVLNYIVFWNFEEISKSLPSVINLNFRYQNIKDTINRLVDGLQ